MSGDVHFNLQQFLSERFDEQRDDIRLLSSKMDTGFGQLHGRISATSARVNDHQTRLTVVEKTHKIVGWFAGAAIIAFLGAVATYLFK